MEKGTGMNRQQARAAGLPRSPQAAANRTLAEAAVVAGSAGGDGANAQDRLAALLAQHATYGHAFLQIACGPDLAEAALARNFDNRPQRPGKIRTMAADMLAGRFKEKIPHPVCFDFNGVLRDGQHRLAAIIASGCTVWLTFCFGCDPTERDYYDQGTSRSVSDIAKEHGQQNTTLASTMVALILRIEQATTQTFGRNEQTERLDRLFRDDPAFDTAIKAGMKLRDLMTPASAGLAHWYIASNTSFIQRLEPFWESLQKGADLKEGSPVLRVRNELLARNHKGMGREGNVKKAAAIVIAWNAFLERRRPRNFDWEETIRLPEVV
jgi:hypothetical protein